MLSSGSSAAATNRRVTLMEQRQNETMARTGQRRSTHNSSLPSVNSSNNRGTPSLARIPDASRTVKIGTERIDSTAMGTSSSSSMHNMSSKFNLRRGRGNAVGSGYYKPNDSQMQMQNTTMMSNEMTNNNMAAQVTHHPKPPSRSKTKNNFKGGRQIIDNRETMQSRNARNETPISPARLTYGSPLSPGQLRKGARFETEAKKENEKTSNSK